MSTGESMEQNESSKPKYNSNDGKRTSGSGPWSDILNILFESLILAQDERWRRASHLQVERSTLPDSSDEGLVTEWRTGE